MEVEQGGKRWLFCILQVGAPTGTLGSIQARWGEAGWGGAIGMYHRYA